MAASLEGNKLVAAVLTAGIIAVGSGVIAGIIYKPHELEEPVYKVATTEAAPATGGAAAEPAKPLPVLLAAANPDSGAGAAKKCVSCHSFEKGGANKVGPNLWGIVGRDIASVPGFAYSDALLKMEGNWDFAKLDAFIHNPKAAAPGTKMSFAGVGKDSERADLLAWLNKQSDSPQPLPSS